MDTYDRRLVQSKIKKVFGSQAKLAALLSDKTPITPMAVSQWFSDHRKGIPPEYCQRIVALSDGNLGAHDLRPDIFPSPNNQSAA